MGGPISTETVQGERGALRITFHTPDLVHVVATGHYGKDLLLPYMRALAKAAQRNVALGFHDWRDMTGYDSECRARMTEWTIQNRPRIDGGHILFKHRIVAMGVATGALLVGNERVRTYSAPELFEQALQQAVQRADGRFSIP